MFSRNRLKCLRGGGGRSGCGAHVCPHPLPAIPDNIYMSVPHIDTFFTPFAEAPTNCLHFLVVFMECIFPILLFLHGYLVSILFVGVLLQGEAMQWARVRIKTPTFPIVDGLILPHCLAFYQKNTFLWVCA